MTFKEFVKEFNPVIQVYGKDPYPVAVLERIFGRIRDLNQTQRKELWGLILDNCRFPPKVPDFIEYASLVRNRAKEWTPPERDGERAAPPREVRELVSRIGKKMPEGV